MKLTKEERIKLTYEIGDIIEQKCRRCVYNRTDDACFNVSVCPSCPTYKELRQLGRYFDTDSKGRGGRKKDIPEGLTPEKVRQMNEQGIPDKDISFMFDRSISYVSKLKKYWQKQGLWKGTRRTWKGKRHDMN
ncbi:hypothetical protein BAMA_15505 [Bacillus manliponensis]|uniref:Uncharacterized protein n=1 Tax=Bacillus manliponensis TaxID=574376 RepID=A0A073JT45_9BACI|nr:hypothetical protein [Bacillus manliponensis]KEK17361.1 hypothetical protein BAMA_15505 [Bacillus manliponensis]